MGICRQAPLAWMLLYVKLVLVQRGDHRMSHHPKRSSNSTDAISRNRPARLLHMGVSSFQNQ